MKKALIPTLCLLISSGLLAQDIISVPLVPSSRNDSPVIAFTQDGRLWVAWSSFEAGRAKVAVASRHDGRWSTIDYPDDSRNNQIEPQWIVGPSQHPSLVYTVFNGHSWTIRYVERGLNGWGLPEVLGEGVHPSATATRDGGWVSWENDKGLSLCFPAKNARGAAGREQMIVPDRDGLAYVKPRLASGPGGEVWLAWTGYQLGRASVRVKRIDIDGFPELNLCRRAEICRDPSLSVDPAGRAWIVSEALIAGESLSSQDAPVRSEDLYLMDRPYQVEKPGRVLVVTDGRRFWNPGAGATANSGLAPTVHCSRQGRVWLLCRQVNGFSPLVERLDSRGWMNYGSLWPNSPYSKTPVTFAEAPDGTVWACWTAHNRKRTTAQETPSWTLLDASDSILLARLPDQSAEAAPPLDLFEIPPPTEPLPPPPSLPRYKTTYDQKTQFVYFGDLHVHSEFSTCGRRNGDIEQSQDYSRYVRGLDFMCTSDHSEHLNDANWNAIRLAAHRRNRTGEFAVFTGFEYTSEFDGGGNLYRGHYNVIYRDVDTGGSFFSASEPKFNTPAELWQALKTAVGGSENVLTFPHHPSRRLAWLSWNYYDPDMVPVIEIAQARGSFEYEGCPNAYPLDNDIQRVRGHFIHDGLARGMRWGFVAGGDHGGRQLTAVFSPHLDRGSIFEAIKDRRVYATSGERIFLDVRINEKFMGEEVVVEDGMDRQIVIQATGTSPLVQIDLFRNNHIIQQWKPTAPSSGLTWTDGEPLFQKENSYYVRVIQKDGGMAWSSPIWVINKSVPGSFLFQVGGDELHVLYPEQEADISILSHNCAENVVRGIVSLDVPDGWMIKEKNGLPIECSVGSWSQAIFHVTVPRSAGGSLAQVEVFSKIRFDNGETRSSPLFVVVSSKPVSREIKAALIDAKTEVPGEKLRDYIEKMAVVWGLI